MKLFAVIIFLIFSKVVYCQQDTIPVIMLYSDTVLTDLYGVDDEGMEYSELGFDEYAYWMRGFKVGDNYLDADKKRLPISCVVWIYKTIK